jgi:hypothetical protein
MSAFVGEKNFDVIKMHGTTLTIVKLLPFHHLFAAKFIISINDTFQVVMLKCHKTAHVVISFPCASHECIRGIGSINPLTLIIGK